MEKKIYAFRFSFDDIKSQENVITSCCTGSWEYLYWSKDAKVIFVVAEEMTFIKSFGLLGVDLVTKYTGMTKTVPRSQRLPITRDVVLNRDEARTLLRVIRSGWSGLDHDEVKATNEVIDKLKG